MNTLTLQRHTGEEIYPITKAIATWDEQKNEKFLYVEIETGTPIKTIKQNEVFNAKPSADIYLPVNSFDLKELEDASFKIEKGYDSSKYDFVSAHFYYIEHGEIDKNQVTLKHLRDNVYSLRWTGETKDVNYGKEEVPATKVLIETEVELVTK